MERLTTSVIWLLLALSFVNAKANDVPRQNEDIIANYSLDEDDTLRCGIYAALDYCQERQQKVVHFNTIDPKADQYPELNPYLYCAGNPMMYVDPNGMDLEQRLKAIEKAFLYLKLNVGYEYNGKGEPGTKVDCSGMVSKCIVEGGEEDPVKNGTGNGVKRIADVCQKITRQSDIEVGNLIVFGNSKKLTHIAIIIKIEKDSDGNITNIYFIHSCSSKGCEINNIKNTYWGPKINGYYKWDMTMDGYQELDEVHVLAPSLIPPRQDKINCPKISPKELRLEMVNPILER